MVQIQKQNNYITEATDKQVQVQLCGFQWHKTLNISLHVLIL